MALPDGREVRLAYDGRNGQPYTSIGRLLIEAGEIAEREMSLARLKSLAARARPRARATEDATLMQRNRSYVFFRVEEDFDPSQGPIGGAGRRPDAAALDRGRPLDLGLRHCRSGSMRSCLGRARPRARSAA